MSADDPLVVHRDAAACELVHRVEGVALEVPAEARVLARGDRMIVIEVVMPADQGSPPHVHDHESVGYVVSGQVRSTIGGVAHDLIAGDGFRHPPGVVHDMVAVGGQAVWVEVKSPPTTTWEDVG